MESYKKDNLHPKIKFSIFHRKSKKLILNEKTYLITGGTGFIGSAI